MEMWGCIEEGIELAEWYIGTRSTAQMCDAEDGFDTAYYGSMAMKACPSGYRGGIYRLCKDDGTLDRKK